CVLEAFPRGPMSASPRIRRSPPSRPRKPSGFPRLDGVPHRAWSSINARHNEKLGYDLGHAWFNAEHGQAVSACDFFSHVWSVYLQHANIPADIRERILQAMR